jgi:hypothetical protein
MSEEEYQKLHAAMETLVFLTQELEKKRVSVQRLVSFRQGCMK